MHHHSGCTATPSRLIGAPNSTIPPFLCQMPFLTLPSQFFLAWDRHQICWLAYQVAWFLTLYNSCKNIHLADICSLWAPLVNACIIHAIVTQIRKPRIVCYHFSQRNTRTKQCWLHNIGCISCLVTVYSLSVGRITPDGLPVFWELTDICSL